MHDPQQWALRRVGAVRQPSAGAEAAFASAPAVLTAQVAQVELSAPRGGRWVLARWGVGR